jgi:hypothetical protein
MRLAQCHFETREQNKGENFNYFLFVENMCIHLLNKSSLGQVNSSQIHSLRHQHTVHSLPSKKHTFKTNVLQFRSSLLEQTLDPPRPRSASLVVEERIRSIVLKRQPRKSAISQLEALGQHLCSALEAVYGPRNKLTYV